MNKFRVGDSILYRNNRHPHFVYKARILEISGIDRFHLLLISFSTNSGGRYNELSGGGTVHTHFESLEAIYRLESLEIPKIVL